MFDGEEISSNLYVFAYKGEENAFRFKTISVNDPLIEFNIQLDSDGTAKVFENLTPSSYEYEEVDWGSLPKAIKEKAEEEFDRELNRIYQRMVLRNCGYPL